MFEPRWSACALYKMVLSRWIWDLPPLIILFKTSRSDIAAMTETNLQKTKAAEKFVSDTRRFHPFGMFCQLVGKQRVVRPINRQIGPGHSPRTRHLSSYGPAETEL